MNLNELRDNIHENAKSKGFYDDEMKSNQWNLNCKSILKHAFFAQKIALLHSKLSEALEADRKEKHVTEGSYRDILIPTEGTETWKKYFEGSFKNTVEDELADVFIRVLDLCGWLNINIEKHVELKMKYNELREYKHGKNY